MNKFIQFLYRNVISVGLVLIVIVTATYAVSTHNDSRNPCGCGRGSNTSDTSQLPIRQDTPLQQMPSNPQQNEGSSVQSGAPVQGGQTGGSGGYTDPCSGCQPSAGTVCPETMCPVAQ